MRRTWPGSTPKLIITAMSRVFSITIMVSAMRMLSAATMTMSAMTMKVTTCSSLSARKSSRFCSIQLVVMKPLPAACSMACPISGARLRLSTLKLMTESRSGSSKRRCASARRMKPISSRTDRSRSGRCRRRGSDWNLGTRPMTGQFALRAGDDDLIADLDADLLGEIAAENDRRQTAARLRAECGVGLAAPAPAPRRAWRFEQIADGALFGWG